MIGIVTIAYYRFKLNSVLAFWIAYILTRPLGASLGDFLSQPLDASGLALGTVETNAIFLITIFGVVIYLRVLLQALFLLRWYFTKFPKKKQGKTH